MNDAPRLVVIIPAYNAERFIERSVKSVLSQSFTDLTLIVADDGSTDRTGELLQEMAARDSRLLPLTLSNGGPAQARNRALELVPEGAEYIMFMDADDELLPDAAEYALGGSHGADLVIFGFSIINPDGSRRDYCEPESLLDREALGGPLSKLYKANLLNQVWGKLFKASLIRGGALSFPDYRWGEDRLFIYDCLERASLTAVLPECKYRYMMNPGESLINRYYDKKFPVCLMADERMEALCLLFGVTEEADFRYMFSKGVFSCLTTLFSPSCPLTAGEKRAFIREVVSNERVLRRCDRVFGGFAANFLCAVVRSGSVPLNYQVFRLVALTGRVNPRLFQTLKHRK